MSTINKSIFSAILVFLLSSCASVPLESTNIPSAEVKGWKVGHSQDVPGKGNIVEYVQESETVENWTKLITIQFMEGNMETPRVFMDRLESSVKGKCPNSKWSVIGSTDTTILYEWSVVDCKGQSNQHEIAKLLKGNDGLHRAAYTEKKVSINPSVRAKWVEWLTEAYVFKDGNRVVVQ